MSPGSSTESYPAFARIGLRENPGKNLNQVTCPDRDSNPGHLVSQPDALTVTPQVLVVIFPLHLLYRRKANVSDSENDLQLAAYKLNEIAKKFNMTISESKSKVMAFNGKDHTRCNISINDSIIEQVKRPNFMTQKMKKKKKKNIIIIINISHLFCFSTSFLCGPLDLQHLDYTLRIA
ncbi:hypothetical protein ANN_22236 [Periplaneta americana]|uniref:Uncharacterized protein n=1 Tax=Periplaneta americana TaxID=6978 RepID=A0ABQ8S7V9_PERAM|nr:hypothetical protein ANN_22236 [Periplaneta americana]